MVIFLLATIGSGSCFYMLFFTSILISLHIFQCKYLYILLWQVVWFCKLTLNDLHAQFFNGPNLHYSLSKILAIFLKPLVKSPCTCSLIRILSPSYPTVPFLASLVNSLCLCILFLVLVIFQVFYVFSIHLSICCTFLLYWILEFLAIFVAGTFSPSSFSTDLPSNFSANFIIDVCCDKIEIVLLNNIIGRLKQWLKGKKFPLEKQYFDTILHFGPSRMVLWYPNYWCIHMNRDTLWGCQKLNYQAPIRWVIKYR